MSNDMFNLFIEHMTKSAQDYQDLLASNKRKDILFDLFTSLDRAEVSYHSKCNGMLISFL